MTPATWWALIFIAACVVLIVWVRVKYPVPEARRSAGKSRGTVLQRRRTKRVPAKARKR